MPRKRKDLEIEEPEVPQPEQTAVNKRKGIYVPLTDDGALDLARVKAPDQMDAARIALGAGGGVDGAAAVTPLDRALVGNIVDAYALLLQQGTRLLKWPAEARSYIVFEGEAKEKIVDPLGKVLDKYGPAYLAKNQDVLSLVLAVGVATKTVLESAMQRYVAEHPEVLQRMTATPITPVEA